VGANAERGFVARREGHRGVRKREGFVEAVQSVRTSASSRACPGIVRHHREVFAQRGLRRGFASAAHPHDVRLAQAEVMRKPLDLRAEMRERRLPAVRLGEKADGVALEPDVERRLLERQQREPQRFAQVGAVIRERGGRAQPREARAPALGAGQEFPRAIVPGVARVNVGGEAKQFAIPGPLGDGGIERSARLGIAMQSGVRPIQCAPRLIRFRAFALGARDEDRQHFVLLLQVPARDEPRALERLHLVPLARREAVEIQRIRKPALLPQHPRRRMQHLGIGRLKMQRAQQPPTGERELPGVRTQILGEFPARKTARIFPRARVPRGAGGVPHGGEIPEQRVARPAQVVAVLEQAEQFARSRRASPAGCRRSGQFAPGLEGEAMFRRRFLQRRERRRGRARSCRKSERSMTCR
jgi:hypothetical protein